MTLTLALTPTLSQIEGHLNFILKRANAANKGSHFRLQLPDSLFIRSHFLLYVLAVALIKFSRSID